jgi:hypothetical protein
VFYALLQGFFCDKNYEYDRNMRAGIELGGQTTAR